MINDEKLNTIRSTIFMINRGLKLIGVESKIVINLHDETVTVYHSYAKNNCIDTEKLSYTFPLSMLL